MDFLKSCKTNFRVVENVLESRYSLYRPQDGETDSSRIHSIMTHLRERDVLCALAKDEIWVFASSETDLTDLFQSQRQDWKMQHTDVISADLSVRSADGRLAKDMLMEAIERSIASSLSKQQGIVRVGSWQWIFTLAQDGGDDGGSVLLRLHVNLTETGNLVLYIKVHPCGLTPLTEPVTPQKVVLAPFGNFATLATEPIEHDLEWKRNVSEDLAAEGIYINGNEQWVAIEFMNEEQNCYALWPLRLCFSCAPDLFSKRHLRERGNWKQWFHRDTPEAFETSFQNPLTVAEEWFLKISTLSAIGSDQSREMHAAIEDAVDTNDSIAMTPLVTSPPFNQRNADLQAAMSGIYPTPPDGLIPAPAPSQNTATSEGLADALHANDGTQFSDSIDGQRTQGGSTISSGPMATYPADNEDLFGDINDMDFGANQVGDADFDYFDEPDEVVDLMTDHEPDPDVEMASEGALVEQDDQSRMEDLLDTNPVNEPLASLISSPVAQSPEEAPTKLESPDDHEAPMLSDQLTMVPKKQQNPLSPFHIRERLLPPPVPASAQQPSAKPVKRNRTFGPMDFNENLDLGSKYSSYSKYSDVALKEQNKPGITLPRSRKRSRISASVLELRTDEIAEGETSDEDSQENTSHTSDIKNEDLPPALPWEVSKGSRGIFDAHPPAFRTIQSYDDMQVDEMDQKYSDGFLTATYRKLFQYGKWKNELECISSGNSLAGLLPGEISTASGAHLPSIGTLFELSQLDLISIAQIISEQAASTTESTVHPIPHMEQLRSEMHDTSSSLTQAIINKCIDRVLPGAEECTIEKLLLSREGPARMTNSSRTPTNPQNLQSLAREGVMQAPPVMFSVPAPFVRVQRGSDTWEMLPPALPFWSALGLGPANEQKDVEAVFMIPENEDLALIVEDFAEDLRQAYESCKLGSFSRAKFGSSQSSMQAFDNGMVRVGIPEADHVDIANVLQKYGTRCSELGKLLAGIEEPPSDRTTVVCMVNPFEEHLPAKQYLCACFWLSYKAYRDKAKDSHRSHPRRDLVLQIIPISLIASPNEMAVLDAQRIAALVMEIYDRCPPSAHMARSVSSSSSLPILAAPAVELAAVPPRRIGFQLSSDPPGDLLHEGSILHVAYALSNDAQWLTAFWIDSTGHYQRSISLSMRGKSLADVAVNLWDQTLDILSAREVMWRVFVVSAAEVDSSVIACWKKVVTAKARKQMLHVTMLSLEADPAVQLTPTQFADATKPAGNATTPGGGFLTPASTPQASTFTVSPDASGSGQTNAPLTPAPSENTGTVPENDPDAFLIDSADETWGILLSPTIVPGSSTGSSEGVSMGLLLCRGLENAAPLEALGVNLYWDIRLRPNGLVDDGHSRQVESSLREVMKMYRNLCLLAKIRGLHGRSSGDRDTFEVPRFMPVHALCAIEGARALNGLLR